MKKLRICLTILFFISFQVLAQPPDPGDCDPSAGIDDPNYCAPIPVDTNVILLVIAGVGFGLWKLRTRIEPALNLNPK